MTSPKFCDKKIQLQLDGKLMFYRVTYTESRGGSRISRGTNSRGGAVAYYFAFCFPKNCMKMKEFALRGRDQRKESLK